MDVLTMSFFLIFSLISPYISMFVHLSFPVCSTADVPANEVDKQALVAFKSLITDDPLMALAS